MSLPRWCCWPALPSRCLRCGGGVPYLVTGWLWYLGVLVPVNGIVQVGSHAGADRYTYVPLVGVFIMVAWGVHDLARRLWPKVGDRERGRVLAGIAVVVVLALMACSWLQVDHWRNSMALFDHALRVTEDNARMEDAMGLALARHGRYGEAIEHYEEALRIAPGYSGARYNYAITLAELGRTDDAALEYIEAIRLNPRNANAHNNLGLILVDKGQIAKAIGLYSRGLSIDPNHPLIHFNLGEALMKLGRYEEAAAHFSAVLEVNPDHANARRRLQEILSMPPGVER